jgi:hypothetical protein
MPSLVKIMHCVTIDEDGLRNLPQPARLIVLLSTFVDEARARGAAGDPLAFGHSPDLLAGQAEVARAAYLSSIERLSSVRMHALGVDHMARSPTEILAICYLDLYNAVEILRMLPLEKLHQINEWQTTIATKEQARLAVSDMFQADIKRTRQCLWHAAQLFRRRRDLATMDSYEPLGLLIAANYIRAYDELVICADLERLVTSVPHVAHEPNQTHDAETLLRLDHEDQSSSFLATWRDGRLSARLHISGIGCLDGKRSPARILRESQRIMFQYRSKSPLARSLGICFGQHLQGQQPAADHFD